MYAVSYRDIDSFGGGSVRNIQVNGSFFYYTVMESRDGQNFHRFYRQDIKSGGAVRELYANAEDGQRTGLYAFFADEKGYGYVILKSSEEDGSGEQYFLCKYGISGSELFRREITGQMTAETEEPNFLRGLAVDGEGRICICLSREVCLYDESGSLLSQVRLPQEAAEAVCGGDGRIYVTCRTGMGTALRVVDFEKKELREVCDDFPGEGSLSAGVEYDLVAKDGEKLYGYTDGMELPRVLLWWKDCDLYGGDVDYVCGLEDGRLLAVTREAGGGSRLALLSPTGLEGIPEKEVITIGLMAEQSNQEMDIIIANFNRSSEHYRAELVVYGKGCTSSAELAEALDAANLAIVSGKGPDLIAIGKSYVMVDLYVQKGILEDLNGYLDQSQVLDREMFLESALNIFAYGDGLYGLPLSVYVKTIAGRSSQVGEDMGWTLEDMERLWREHPDAQLFSCCSKIEILRTYLGYSYNLEEFVDWERGSCSFDSEEFKDLLEFASHFPMEAVPDPALSVADGDILLECSWIDSLGSYTGLRETFGGEAFTCVGYPCRSGSGSMLGTSEGTFGISALSEHKEGAWEFIEYMLSDERNVAVLHTLPVRKDWLERQFLQDMGKDYAYDGAGNILRDENGRPQTVQVYEMVGHPPGEEDVEPLMQLLEAAEPYHGSWGKIFNIITEEAAPYFHGQKTLEQVVEIIQSRAQIYVSENM